jgi:hypothetical protein
MNPKFSRTAQIALVFVVFLLLYFFVKHQNDALPPEKIDESISMQRPNIDEYTTSNPKISEIGGMVQATVDVIVKDPKITKQRLRAVLEYELMMQKQRKGIHQPDMSANKVLIYAYPSLKNAEKNHGNWLGMVYLNMEGKVDYSYNIE